MNELYQLMQLAAQHFNETVHDLLLPGRDFRRTRVRHIIYYCARKRYGYTYKSIGMLFGRHHASVIHGVKRIETDMQLYEFERNRVRAFELILELNDMNTARDANN